MLKSNSLTIPIKVIVGLSLVGSLMAGGNHSHGHHHGDGHDHSKAQEVITLPSELAAAFGDWKKSGAAMAQLDGQVKGFSQRLKMLMGQNPQLAQFFQMYDRLVTQQKTAIIEHERNSQKILPLVEAHYKSGKASADVKLIYARIVGSRKQNKLASKLYHEVLKEGKLSDTELIVFAEILNQQNRVAETIKVLKEREKKVKKDSEIYDQIQLLLSQCYFYIQDFDTAITLAKQLQLKPKLKASIARALPYYEKTKKKWLEELEFRKKDKNLPQVEMTTSKGKIVIDLFEDDAPNAVANFVELTEKKYYDNQAFHRVLPNFMAQGGDPNSKDADPSNDGQGGPGYTIKTDLSKRNHFRGVISMANAGKDTDGSQFFLTVVPTYWLDGKHAVFGRISAGQDVIDSLEKGDKLILAKILKKRNHVYKAKRHGKK